MPPVDGDVEDVIPELNPILLGWGNYFRTGNSARKFNQLDSYVWWRLKRLLIKRLGRVPENGTHGLKGEWGNRPALRALGAPDYQ